MRSRLEAPAWALSDGELVEALVEVHGREQRLATANWR